MPARPPEADADVERDPVTDGDAPDGDAPAPPAPALTGRADRLILAYVAGILILWAPGLNLGLLTPRVALVLVGLGPGLVVVGSLVRRRDPGAAWLVGFLAWGLVCVAFSALPRLSFLGTYGSDTGWIYLAGYASAWGLGRRLSPVGLRLLPAVLLAGLSANVALALLEAVFEPVGILGAVDGRVLGLMSNPLFLAGALSGGLVLLGYLIGSDGRRQLLFAGLAIAFTTAINVTGSRAALVGGVLLGVGASVAGSRSRGADGSATLRSVGLVVAAVALGFLCSLPVQSEASGTSRVGDVSSASGYGSRLTMWGAGLEATGEQPVVGWGPGRFREATSTRTTADFARSEQPDRLFYDAHNVFVEQLVTTGVVGFVLFAGFVVMVVRRARGPLAWFAAGVALTWLLNPLSVCTAPVVLVAIGAAWNQVPARRASSPDRVAVARGVGAVLAAVGLVVGSVLVWTDVLIERGSTDADVATIRSARQLRPGDPVLQALLTDALAAQALDDPTGANEAEVVASAEEAVRLDPTRSTWWVRRGNARGAFGPGTTDERVQAAEEDYERALERSPWSFEALSSLRDVAIYREDAEAVARWTDRICQITRCPAP